MIFKMHIPQVTVNRSMESRFSSDALFLPSQRRFSEIYRGRLRGLDGVLKRVTSGVGLVRRFSSVSQKMARLAVARCYNKHWTYPLFPLSSPARSLGASLGHATQ